MLTILYHHVPSVTSMPVYLGRIDKILLPYVAELTEEQLYPKLKRCAILIERYRCLYARQYWSRRLCSYTSNS